PGQHLPIRVTLPGTDKPLIRTYTLSHAPSDDGYRISVKRESLVSRHLHEQLREGDVLETRAPAGDFTLDMASSRPVVLLAGGIGITPMLAML
ncbi:FAD-binding oxidoreductase, partial [Acinetobacter baumannii]|nr:FAD-binding oxidoreductase [Acinetobacter baumannii]